MVSMARRWACASGSRSWGTRTLSVTPSLVLDDFRTLAVLLQDERAAIDVALEFDGIHDLLHEEHAAATRLQ